MDHDDAMDAVRAVTAAFDPHDLEEILRHFADDAVFDGPRGPDRWGQRFVGRDQIRAAYWKIRME
ncbi:MAG TPA: nuclear transport factor 2 family protein [Patescibacteria group bacterium]|nr:nuclear transport factor 2 family protein [Patescibacteria group bacterium]